MSVGDSSLTLVMVMVMVSESAAVPSVAATTRSYDESLSKSKSVLSPTVIAPVPAAIAKTSLVSVLPPVMDHVRLPVSPVASTSTTAASSAAFSARLAEVSVTTTASSVILIVKVRSAVLLLASVARTITVQLFELEPQPGASKLAPVAATNLSVLESISNRLLSFVVIA